MIGRRVAISSGHVLAVIAVLLPTIAIAAPKAEAPLLAVAALATLGLGGYRDLPKLEPLRVLATLVILLGVVGLASALWSVVPWHSVSVGIKFLAVAGGGMVLLAAARAIGEREREILRRALACGFALALIVLAIAALVQKIGVLYGTPSGMGASWTDSFNRFDRAATTIALTLWPVLLMLMQRQHPRWAIVLAVATTLVVSSLNSQAAMLSLLVGFAIWPLAWSLPRLAAGVIGAGVIALVAIPPSLNLSLAFIARAYQAAPWLKISAIHRLAIWHFAIDRINERPLLGWGLDASRAMPHGSEVIAAPGLEDLQLALKTWMPLHPHNAALQWRLELGLPGALLATLVVLWPLWRIGTSRSLPRAHQAAGIAFASAALVIAFLSYGIWQEWWICELWMLATLFVAQSASGPLAAEGTLRF